MNHFFHMIDIFINGFKLDDFNISSLIKGFCRNIPDGRFFTLLSDEASKLNLSPKNIIRVYEYFLTGMKNLIDLEINFTPNSFKEALFQLMRINLKNTICGDFFSYFDMSKFSSNNIIEIVRVAQNSKITFLNLMNFDGRNYFPCINCFFNSAKVTDRTKKDVETFLTENTPNINFNYYSCEKSSYFFWYNYKFPVEIFHSFNDIAKNQIIGLREKLSEHFEFHDSINIEEL